MVHCANSGQINPLQNPRYSTGGFVKNSAFAKINLFLAIAGRRNDRYHEIVSVMQSVGLCDELRFEIGNGSGEPVELEIAPGIQQSRPQNCNVLHAGADNLVVKAANLFLKTYNITTPVKIILDKHIPIGAGLGGGSSNAAATLQGLNCLFGLNIPQEELATLGVQLGADVPFCITGGTALATGIGEKLTPLVPHPPCHILLACPPVHVSTGEIFGMLKQPKLDSRILTKLEGFFTACNSKDVSQIAQHLENIFTPITSVMHPQITTLITDMKNHGALNASMTGTGATVFAYFENEHTARQAYDILQEKHKGVRFIQTETLNRKG